MKKNVAKNASKFERFFAGPKVLQFILKLDQFFLKLPHLPKKFNLFISKLVPWLALLGGIVSFAATILSLLLTILSLIAFDLTLILSMGGTFILALLNSLLLIKSFKPLRKNDAVGWIYLFWANVLALVNTAIDIISGELTGLSQIPLNLIIGALGFYLLFEIGQFYTYTKE